MSFRISISPQRKRSKTGMPQSARTIKSSITSPLVNLIEEIKIQMKQLNPEFQTLLHQLFKLAIELEKKNPKLSSHIKQKSNCGESSEPSQEKQKSRETSPRKSIKYVEMTSSSKLDPTPKQKFVLRRGSLDEQPINKDQLRKISQEAIDQNFIYNLLDFKQSHLKSMTFRKFNQLFTQNEKDLYSSLQKIDYQGIQQVYLGYLVYLYEPIKFAKDLSTSCIYYIEKLKKIIQSYLINQTSSPTDIFDNYSKLFYEVFPCDRAYVYLYDCNQNVFWTKNQESCQKILLPLKGIPGFVKKTAQMININEVYSDVRFDPDYDYKQQMKTKAMLATPIIDKDEVIGVILLSSSQNQFKKDDELLLQIISQSCSPHFSQLVQQEFNSKSCQALQQIVKFSLLLSQSIDQKQFAILAKEILLQNYELKQVQIFLRDMQDQDCLFTYVGQTRKKISKNCGIVGYVYKNGQYYISDSCYQDRYYNKLADIETNLPTITIPIQHDKNRVMGVIQYVDTKGIDNIVGKHLKNLQFSNIELIQAFASMISFVNNKLIVQKQY